MKLSARWASPFTRFSLWTASLFGERVKKSRGKGREMVRAWRETFEAAIPPSCLVIAHADHLSARSSSVTWIHWNVITKGVGRQHTTSVSCQNTACSNQFFLWWVDYALEGLGLIEKMWCLPLISYWEFVTRILIFCGYCFWSAWFALWYKNVYCR